MEFLLNIIAEMREFINPNLDVCGILLTMVDKLTNFAKEVIRMIENAYGEEIRIFGDKVVIRIRGDKEKATAELGA